MERLFWIGVAGACGTCVRYLVGLWASKTLGPQFPYGTLIVNVAGCFLIALVLHIALSTTWLSDTWRAVLATGFMGGLTTYSSFNYETTRLAQNGTWGLSALNFAVTTVGCLLAGLLGLAVARRLVGA